MRGEITDCSLDLHLHSAWINLLRDASRGIMPARPNRLSTNETGSEEPPQLCRSNSSPYRVSNRKIVRKILG